MNITVIIPVHEFNETVQTYLDKAIESIQKQENINEKPQILIVYPTLIDDELKVYMKKYFETDLKILYVKNEGNIDYQSQVNLAVDSVITDYFTVLEFDDELGTTYCKNSSNYIANYPEIDLSYMDSEIE